MKECILMKAKMRAEALKRGDNEGGGEVVVRTGINIGKAMYEAGKEKSIQERAAEVRAEIRQPEEVVQKETVQYEEEKELTLQEKANLVKKESLQGNEVEQVDPSMLK